MTQENENLIGTVENIVYKNDENGYAVIEVLCSDAVITAVGTFAGVCIGEELEMSGKYITHPEYGRQFKSESCEFRLPISKKAIEKYLSSGAVKGIGPVAARKIVALYGTESLDIIFNEPQKLSKIKGITPLRAVAISKEFRLIFGIRETLSFLSGLGIKPTTALEVYSVYTTKTISLVKQNPYILCKETEFLDFSSVDEIARTLLPFDMENLRVPAGLHHVLRHNLNSGHSCIPTHKLVDTTTAFLKVDKEIVQREYEKECEAGAFVKTTVNQIDFTYLPRYLKAEKDVSNKIKELITAEPRKKIDVKKCIQELQKSLGINYADMQKEAIEKAINSGIFILGGGPGTGKTTTLKAVISIFEQNFKSVAIAAPTGRAAKRCFELTGKKAQTIHRLLEVDFSSKEELRFIRNEEKPLKNDVIIIDEMSMVDIFIFDSLLKALKKGAKLILIGDYDQLPSVGSGNVLRCLLDSGAIESITLNEIFRQAADSLIIKNAHLIRQGQNLQQGEKDNDFFFIEKRLNDAVSNVCELFSSRLPTYYGFDATNDIQVLCPSKIGICGTVALNSRLQQLVNPPSFSKPELSINGQIYRLGDKVMQVKNNYNIAYKSDNGEAGLGAFNGDIGFISVVDKKSNSLVVNIDDKKYHYKGEDLFELEIAYAITIHKSQGSEFTCVIIPLSDTPRKLCYRNLLYTGVTRAKTALLIVGEKRILFDMIQNDRKTLRYSCLKEFILQGDEGEA